MLLYVMYDLKWINKIKPNVIKWDFWMSNSTFIILKIIYCITDKFWDRLSYVKGNKIILILDLCYSLKFLVCNDSISWVFKTKECLRKSAYLKKSKGSMNNMTHLTNQSGMESGGKETSSIRPSITTPVIINLPPQCCQSTIFWYSQNVEWEIWVYVTDPLFIFLEDKDLFVLFTVTFLVPQIVPSTWKNGRIS